MADSDHTPVLLPHPLGEKCLSLLAQSCAFRKRHQTLRFGFSLNLAAKSVLDEPEAMRAEVRHRLETRSF
jgi:hypothetical protein